LTPVGTFAATIGPYGTFDQGGNVFEWTESASGTSRAIRGGSYGDTSAWMANTNRLLRAATNEDDGIGFRVAAVPEPGTIPLLLIGVAGLPRFRHWGRPMRRSGSEPARWTRSTERATDIDRQPSAFEALLRCFDPTRRPLLSRSM
jgi:hypothetical protein